MDIEWIFLFTTKYFASLELFSIFYRMSGLDSAIWFPMSQVSTSVPFDCSPYSFLAREKELMVVVLWWLSSALIPVMPSDLHIMMNELQTAGIPKSNVYLTKLS